MIKKATFAGGCFWCMVKPFSKYDGILEVVSGYTGGETENPTYKEVCSGTTGHYEAIEITYDVIKKATFAGGCFWCMVKPFSKYDGIREVVSGYTGGETENPTNKEVCSGTTGHYEAIEITYDDSLIDYGDILDVFWKQIDPTDSNGQFVDRGPQYRPAIFVHDEEQRKIAEQSKKELDESTEVLSTDQLYLFTMKNREK